MIVALIFAPIVMAIWVTEGGKYVAVWSAVMVAIIGWISAASWLVTH